LRGVTDNRPRPGAWIESCLSRETAEGLTVELLNSEVQNCSTFERL